VNICTSESNNVKCDNNVIGAPAVSVGVCSEVRVKQPQATRPTTPIIQKRESERQPQRIEDCDLVANYGNLSHHCDYPVDARGRSTPPVRDGRLLRLVPGAGSGPPPGYPGSLRVALALRLSRAWVVRSSNGVRASRCELWAGSGNLASTARKLGFTAHVYELYSLDGVGQPHYDLLRPAVCQALLADLAAGRWGWVHFGITCKTFSVMQFSCGGSRTYDRPWGDGRVERESDANAEVRAMLAIIYVCIAFAFGVHFAIETRYFLSFGTVPN
jgi:hypothetical protein